MMRYSCKGCDKTIEVQYSLHGAKSLVHTEQQSSSFL